MLAAVGDLVDDFDRLSSIVKRLPRMAELAIQSKTQFGSSEMITEILLMMSANHQQIQVKRFSESTNYSVFEHIH